ncbi:MAG: transglutaminase-like domain-containing protein [Gammaproteobacteria bacterium]|nr:transglutaminase-like domain-containing protein [Gammaproteobacteria bacterium]
MPWSRTFFPAALSHIEQYELDVRWQEDESAPLWSSSTEANGCKLASTTHLRCRAQSIAAVENDEVVLWLDHVAQIVVASPASWQDLAQIVGRYVEQARTADDAIVSKARSLVSGIGAERERLDAIHEFVAREIRYVGLEHGQYSHVPKPSDVTLARRYGDCKDKTTLLIDMLAAVGIEASPVLVATDRFDPSRLDVPAAGYFDHLIACGRLSNGAPFCLDPTDAYSEAASLGGSIQGAVSLPINDEPQPTTLPSDSYRWVLTEQADMLVTAEGHLEETLRLQYEGPYAASLRANLSGLVESELVDWAEETYADVVSTMTTPSFEFAGLDEIEPTLQVNSEASYKKLVAPDEDLNYREDLPWLDRLLGYFITNNEHYYYDFPGVRYESEVRFKIARTWTPDRTGPRVEFRGEFGNLARRYEIDGNLITIKTMVGMPKRRIEVQEMEAFNDFITKLREHNHFRVLATLD